VTDSKQEPPQGLYDSRRTIMETAVVMLVQQMRILYVVGGILVVLGSLALGANLVSRATSLVPVGILMMIAALFEMGIGNKAREEDGPSTPWMTSGSVQMAAGFVTIVSGFLPSYVFTTLLGGALTFAGLTWLRAGFALPPRFQSPIVIICGGVTGLAGLLILSRWHGLNDNLLAMMLGCEILVRGWSFMGFGVGLNRAMKKG
jgi:uncharacterized membrane protein HdeD (DUF308 family)